MSISPYFQRAQCSKLSPLLASVAQSENFALYITFSLLFSITWLIEFNLMWCPLFYRNRPNNVL